VTKRFLIGLILICGLGLYLTPATGLAQQAAAQALVIKPLAEKKVTQLPAGPLFWRLETFSTVAAAQANAGPTSLVVESGGEVWLITLDAPGGATPGGTKVAEVGPLPAVTATNYLLRVNEASGPPGSITSVHTHPGTEAFYVLAGESTSHTPDELIHVGAGRGATGHLAGTPMQVSSTGSTDLLSIVMFLVDADKPFSSPAAFP